MNSAEQKVRDTLQAMSIFLLCVFFVLLMVLISALSWYGEDGWEPPTGPVQSVTTSVPSSSSSSSSSEEAGRLLGLFRLSGVSRYPTGARSDLVAAATAETVPSSSTTVPSTTTPTPDSTELLPSSSVAETPDSTITHPATLVPDAGPPTTKCFTNGEAVCQGSHTTPPPSTSTSSASNTETTEGEGEGAP